MRSDKNIIVQLDWFIKGGSVVCGLPVIHAPKIPLGIMSRAFNSSQSFESLGLTLNE
jgi:hypothetical protein